MVIFFLFVFKKNLRSKKEFKVLFKEILLNKKKKNDKKIIL